MEVSVHPTDQSCMYLGLVSVGGGIGPPHRSELHVSRTGFSRWRYQSTPPIRVACIYDWFQSVEVSVHPTDQSCMYLGLVSVGGGIGFSRWRYRFQSVEVSVSVGGGISPPHRSELHVSRTGFSRWRYQSTPPIRVACI